MKRRIQFLKLSGMIFLLLSTLSYFSWRVFLTLPLHSGLLAFICGSLLLLAELSGLFELLLHFWNLYRLEIPQKPTLLPDDEFPDVDVFIATYNEPISLIHKTLIGCLNMEYPHPEKVHIYVLDDGNRPEMAELCHQLQVGYLNRQENTHAKAGNINHALQHTNSPYVVTFDADMIPRHQFLMETIPYFIENDRLRKTSTDSKKRPQPIGFLQVPQSFYNADCFQYRLFAENLTPNEQNYFHRDVQLGKNSSNSVIYSGSNTVLNRQALDEINGFVTGIITEDIATGIRIQQAGYKCFSLNTIQASGLSPFDLEGLVKQRQRWARGCIQTFKKANPLFMKELTLWQRLNYFDSIIYWFGSLKRLIFIMSPILYSVFGVTVVDASLADVLTFWLPFYLISTYAFPFFSNGVRTTKWTNIYETTLMPPLLTSVLLECLGIEKKKFEVTPKTINLNSERRIQIKLAIPHVILLTLSLIGIYRSWNGLFTSNWESYCLILFWLIHNSAFITLALLFILGRPFYRQSERIRVNGLCEFTLHGIHQSFEIHDLSEQGVSLKVKQLPAIDFNQSYLIHLAIDNRQFSIKAQPLRMSALSTDTHLLVFTFKEIEASAYNDLILSLYDREPQFPEKTRLQLTHRDLIRNICKQFGQKVLRRIYASLKRKKPSNHKSKDS